MQFCRQFLSIEIFARGDEKGAFSKVSVRILQHLPSSKMRNGKTGNADECIVIWKQHKFHIIV